MSLTKLPEDCLRTIQSHLKPEDLFILWRTGAFLKKKIYAKEITLEYADLTPWKGDPNLGLLRIPQIQIDFLFFKSYYQFSPQSDRFSPKKIRVNHIKISVGTLYRDKKKSALLSCQTLALIIDKDWAQSTILKTAKKIQHDSLIIIYDPFHNPEAPLRLTKFPEETQEIKGIACLSQEATWPENLQSLSQKNIVEFPSVLPSSLTKVFLRFSNRIKFSLPDSITDLHIEGNHEIDGVLPSHLKHLTFTGCLVDSYFPKSLTTIRLFGCCVSQKSFRIDNPEQPVLFSTFLPHLEVFIFAQKSSEDVGWISWFPSFIFPPATREIEFVIERMGDLSFTGDNLKEARIYTYSIHNGSISLPDSLETLFLKGIKKGKKRFYYGKNLKTIETNFRLSKFIPRELSYVETLNLFCTTDKYLRSDFSKLSFPFLRKCYLHGDHHRKSSLSCQFPESLEKLFLSELKGPYNFTAPNLKYLSLDLLEIKDFGGSFPESIETLEIQNFSDGVHGSYCRLWKLHPPALKKLILRSCHANDLVLPRILSLESVIIKDSCIKYLFVFSEAVKIDFNSSEMDKAPTIFISGQDY